MIEQLAGVLYVAMVVARMVGLTFARIGPQGAGSDQRPRRAGSRALDDEHPAAEE
jgi:hypothetical protein